MLRKRLILGAQDSIMHAVAKGQHDPDNGVKVGDLCLYEWHGRYIYVVREIVRVRKDGNNVKYVGVIDKQYFSQKYPTHSWRAYYYHANKYPDGTQFPSLAVIQRVANEYKPYKSSKKIIVTSVLNIETIDLKTIEDNYDHEIKRAEQYRDMVLGLYNNRHNL